MVFADSPVTELNGTSVRVRAFALRRALIGFRMPPSHRSSAARPLWRGRSVGSADTRWRSRSLAGWRMQSLAHAPPHVRLRIPDLARHHRWPRRRPTTGRARPLICKCGYVKLWWWGETAAPEVPAPLRHLYPVACAARADLLFSFWLIFRGRISVWAGLVLAVSSSRAGSCTRTATTSSTATGRPATTTRATASSTPSPTSWPWPSAT